MTKKIRYERAWLVTFPDLCIDNYSIVFGAVEAWERDAPVYIAQGRYMLDPDDREEALYAAICHVMPTSTRVSRQREGLVACRGMGMCYWKKGVGWLEEPAEGATYFDPFDLLKKTSFLYTV